MNRYDKIKLKQFNRPGIVISHNFPAYLWEYVDEREIVVTFDNPDKGRKYTVSILEVLEIRDQLTDEVIWLPDPNVVQ